MSSSRNHLLKMVPTAWKNKKEDLKNEIAQKTAIIIGYESCLMTQETNKRRRIPNRPGTVQATSNRENQAE